MVKAGSDGSGKMGVTALGLCQMISNGVLARRCAAERQNFEKRKAAANGQRVYQQAIWSCIGGTTSKRAKDGKAEFRRFDIIPGQKDGTYALRAQSCEANATLNLVALPPRKGPSGHKSSFRWTLNTCMRLLPIPLQSGMLMLLQLR